MTNIISKTKSSIKGFAWVFMGKMFDNISQLVIIGILARLLTPEDFGIIGLILLFVNFSNIYTQMGVGTALVQRKTIHSEHISLSYTLAVILGVLIGILFYFLAPSIGEFFNLKGLEKPIQFFSFFFPLKGLNSISESLLQRKLKFPEIVKSQSISYLFGYGLTAITLALMGFGLWSLVYGQLAILLVHTVILLYFIRPKFSIRNKVRTFKDLLFFGSGHTIDLNFNFLANNADNIIIGKLMDATSLGIYSRAFQFLALPASFFGSIYNKVLFPILSTKQEDSNVLTSFYLFSISFCLLFLLPFSLVLMFNAKLIVLVLLGNQWLDVIDPFQILILGLFIRFGTRINKSFLVSLGLVYHGALYQFIFAVIMITSCLIGVHYLGLIGAAYGVLFATIINYIQVSYRIQQRLSFKYIYFIKLHFRTFLYFSPIAVVILGSYYFGLNDIWLIFLISLAIIIPLIVLSIRHKRSIFYDDHNVKIFNQIIMNSPQYIQRIMLKLKLVK